VVRFLITSRKSLLLGSETCALVDRIIQLRVSICHLPAVHEELKTLYIVRVLRLLLRERRNLDRMIHHERRLDQVLLDILLEEKI